MSNPPVNQRHRLSLSSVDDNMSHPLFPHSPQHQHLALRSLVAVVLVALLGVVGSPSALAAKTATPQLSLGWTLDTAVPATWTSVSTATATVSTATLVLSTDDAATVSLWLMASNPSTVSLSTTALSFHLVSASPNTSISRRRAIRSRSLSCTVAGNAGHSTVPALAVGAQLGTRSDCSLPPALATGDYEVWACARPTARSRRSRRHTGNCSERIALSLIQGSEPKLSIALHWLEASTATSTDTTLVLATGSTATLSLAVAVDNIGTAEASSTSLSYRLARLHEYTLPWWLGGGTVIWRAQPRHLDCGAVALPSLAVAARFSVQTDCELPPQLQVGDYAVWACVEAGAQWRRRSADDCSTQLSLSVVEGPRPNLLLEAYWATTAAPAADSSWLPASTGTTIVVATSTPVASHGSTATLSLWLVAKNTGAAPATATQLHYFITPTDGSRRHHGRRNRHGDHGNVALPSQQAALTAAWWRQFQQLDCGTAELPVQAAGTGRIARRDCLLPVGLSVGSYWVAACLDAVLWEQQRVDNCATALPLQVVAALVTTGTATHTTGTTTAVSTATSSALAQLSLSLAWRMDGSTADVAWRVLLATDVLSTTTTLRLAADGATPILPLSVVLANTGSATAAAGDIKYYLSGSFWQLQRYGERQRRRGFGRLRARSRLGSQDSIEGYDWVRRSVALDCGAATTPQVAAGQSLLRQVDCSLPAGTASDTSYRLWACTTTGAGKSLRLHNCAQFLDLTLPPVATSSLQLSLSGSTLLSDPVLSVQLSAENTGVEATSTATLSYYLAYSAGWWRPLDCGIGADTVPSLAAGATHNWQQDCALPSLHRGHYELKVCFDADTTAVYAPPHNCQSLALRVDTDLIAPEQPDTGTGDLVGTLGTDDVDDITGNGTATQIPVAAKPPPPANFAHRLRVVATSEPQEIQLPVLLHGEAQGYPVELPFTISTSPNAPSGVAGHTVLPSSQVISIASGLRGAIILQLPANYASLDGAPVTLTFAFAANGVRNAVVGHAAQLRVTIHPVDVNLPPKLLHLPRDGIVGMQLRQPASSTPTRAVEQSDILVELTVLARDPNGDAISFQWSLSGPLPSRSILFSGDSTGTLSADTWGAVFSFNSQALEIDQHYLNQVRLDDGRGGVTTVRRRFYVVAEGSSATLRHDSDGNGIGDSHQRHHLHHLLQGTVAESTQHVLMAESGLSIALGEHSERAYQRRGDRPSAALPSDDALLGSVAAAGYTLHDTSGVYDFELHGVERFESGAGGEAMVVLPQQRPIPSAAVYLKYSGDHWQPFDMASGALHSAAFGDDGGCPSPDDDSAYQSGLAEGHHCVRLTLVDGGSNDADGEVNGTVVDPGGLAVNAAIDPPTPISVSSGGGGGATDWLTVLGLLALFGLSLQTSSLWTPHRHRR